MNILKKLLKEMDVKNGMFNRKKLFRIDLKKIG